MNTIHFTYYKFSFGELKIGSFQNELCLCDWRYRKQRALIDRRIANGLKAEFVELETNIIRETIVQLNEYSEGNTNCYYKTVQTVL